MSTKTTIKRIALVAVASLGFGLLSVVPSNAIAVTSIYVSSKSSSSYTNANVAATMDVAITSTSVASVAHGLTSTSIGKAIYSLDAGYVGTIASITSVDAFTLTAVPTIALVAANTGAVAKLRIGYIASTTVANGIAVGQISGMSIVAGATAGLVVVLNGAPATTSRTRVSINGIGVSGVSETSTVTSDRNSIISFTAPITAGVYPMTVSFSELGTFLATVADQVDIAFTLTVTASSGLSTALSTALITNTTTATPTTNAVEYAGYKTVNAAIAQVIVSLKNADGLAPTAAHTVTASISGAGFVLVNTSTAMEVTTGLRSTYASSSAGVAVVHIGADGTTGKGTVTVSVTDSATLATSVLGTFTVTTYGDVAKLEVSTTNYKIGYATGDTTGAAVAARGDAADLLGALTTILTPAFIVKSTDAAGNVSSIANGLVPTIVSSNSVSVSGGTCVLDNGAGAYSSGDGVGYYNCAFSTTAASKSGDKATLTISTLNPATGVTYLTATVDVTVGGAQYKETLSFDKTTYTPGEAMVVTRTAVDSAGNPTADGTAAPAVIFNKYVGGALPLAGFYVGGKNATDATAPTIFAPVSSGTFEGRMTGYNSSATTTSAIIATSTVSADGAETASSAAADAAAEATDAANAATDAANAAAEAADAATAAAQDAADAVAALSVSVTAMVDALRKQITALTNLVIKIQKKVKA
jgi:hypothetical protein